ncbi:Histone-lysine N-methyltransferase H3 lysine-9 specific [Nymphaea thermarum]|nr:Histone-lysine N-methyltransferase H3 lysine-9 specific [Nymphaea thermarum]
MSPPHRIHTPQQVPTILSPSGISASSSSSYFRTEAPYEHLSHGLGLTQATERRCVGNITDSIISKFDFRIGDTQEAGSSSASRSVRLIFQAAAIDRESVERTLMVYHALRRKYLQLEEAEIEKDGDRRRNSFHAHLQAAAKMKDKKLRLTEEKRIGTISGVEVGDMYYYRAEMTMIGLHSPAEAGIDYTTIKLNGVEDTVAISIVTFSGHEGEVDDGEVLIYSGHGKKIPDDQKLERGNLALDRSMNRGVEIRVTRGFKDPTHMTKKVYVYDGLYKITESWMEKSSEGFNVYKCKLVRLPGQPTLGSLILKMTQRWMENPSCRDEALATDISMGRETNPICVVNGVDDERELPPFVYISKLRNAVSIRLSRPARACKPRTGALCSCFQANGNEFPYADNGTLVRRMPVVIECGSSCSCVYGCPNRVSQQGLYFHFEVFRTRDRGWGLRSWDLIPAGAFICELAGEGTTRENVRTDGDDEYVFDTERATARPLEWEGTYEVIGEARPQSSGMDVGAISIVADARRTGNLSRFINHSCSPNVFWQLVVYDKHGLIFPRVVLFAMKNIPPLTE